MDKLKICFHKELRCRVSFVKNEMFEFPINWKKFHQFPSEVIHFNAKAGVFASALNGRCFPYFSVEFTQGFKKT